MLLVRLPMIIVTRKHVFQLEYSTKAEVNHDLSSHSFLKQNFIEHLLCAGTTVVKQGDMECLPSWAPQLGRQDRC